MEQIMEIRDLKLRKSTELWEMSEGDVNFQNISEKEVENWITDNGELVEHNEI